MKMLTKIEEAFGLQLSENDYDMENNKIVRLRLGRHAIRDLDVLSSMTSLRWLYLDRNQIEDLSPLSGLHNLKTLDLDTNNIVDITPLANLKNLHYLVLANNRIKTVSVLPSLKEKLLWLDVGNNPITDIEPLLDLKIQTYTNKRNPYLGGEHIINMYGLPVFTSSPKEVSMTKDSVMKLSSGEPPEIINKESPISFFVLMPFDVKFDSSYAEIKEIIEKRYSAKCERADELFTTTPVIDDLLNCIRNASVIVADLTDRNPNVFYELGIAHACRKITILLTRDKNDVPFDLQKWRYIEYKDSMDGAKKLKSALRKTIDRIMPRNK